MIPVLLLMKFKGYIFVLKMEYFKSFITGRRTEVNRNYKIQQGLDFAKLITHDYPYRQKIYNNLENMVRTCQKEECPYSSTYLREYSNRISPGLGMVDVIWDMADTVGNPNGEFQDYIPDYKN